MKNYTIQILNLTYTVWAVSREAARAEVEAMQESRMT